MRSSCTRASRWSSSMAMTMASSRSWRPVVSAESARAPCAVEGDLRRAGGKRGVSPALDVSVGLPCSDTQLRSRGGGFHRPRTYRDV